MFPFIRRIVFFDIAGENIDKFSIGWFGLETAACDLKKTFSVSAAPAKRDDSADIALNTGWSRTVDFRYQGIEKLGNHQKAVLIFQNKQNRSV